MTPAVRAAGQVEVTLGSKINGGEGIKGEFEGLDAASYPGHVTVSYIGLICKCSLRNNK